jgi:hypothetical protein
VSAVAISTELTVEHADGGLYIVDRAGEEPAIVEMHSSATTPPGRGGDHVRKTLRYMTPISLSRSR